MSLHLFYSYAADSRKDESFLSELEKHLSSLEREGLIKSWSPRRIQAGMVRKELRRFCKAGSGGIHVAQTLPLFQRRGRIGAGLHRQENAADHQESGKTLHASEVSQER